MLSWKNILILFVVGGLGGALCDAFHSHSGILAYPDPWIFNMAWWVPLLFGSATLTVAFGHLWYDRLLRLPYRYLSDGDVVSGMVAFVVLYAASAYMPLSDDTKTVVFGIAVVLMAGRWNRNWHAIPQMAATALIGCSVEIALSHSGYFHYLHPDFWGIPMWLPFLYAAASVAVGNWARWLQK